MRLSFLLPLLLSVPVLAQAPLQTQPTAQSAAPVTIRAQAKLVAVDVVVTDKDRHPVHDLKQSDFTVLENRQPQSINSFAEFKVTPPPPVVKLPPMPPGYFTNDTPRPTSKAVNILLLDALNTPITDQNYLHQQLLEFLKKTPPGSNTAIFGLSTKLVMLQGFSTDPEVLKNALIKQTSKASKNLNDVIGGNGTPDTADDVNTAMDGALSTAQVAALQSWMDMQQSFQTMVRVKDTLDAMNVLAHWLATIPGRKNLIWFSGSFPLQVMPDVSDNPTDPFAGDDDAEAEYAETKDLLARAQIAVYPIDARGLQVAPSAGGALAGTSGVRMPTGRGAPLADPTTRFALANFDEHQTMQRLADDTGGKAFFNTNGLVDAMARAIDDGSSFYTLTYTPTDTSKKGDFRKVEIKLAQQGYTLEYRKGYYADTPNAAVAKVDPLAASTTLATVSSPSIVKAMVHGVPGATQVLYKLRVLPTYNAQEDSVAPGNIFNEANKPEFKGPFRRYSVDFAVVPIYLSFLKTPDGKYHTNVAFVSIVYDRDGQLVNRIARAVPATLSEEQYQHVMQKGFPFHQEISVPLKGDFTIRTGVHDIRSNKIGATEVPLSLVKSLPPVNANAPPPAPAESQP
jgi:VWFA-related protein